MKQQSGHGVLRQNEVGPTKACTLRRFSLGSLQSRSALLPPRSVSRSPTQPTSEQADTAHIRGIGRFLRNSLAFHRCMEQPIRNYPSTRPICLTVIFRQQLALLPECPTARSSSCHFTRQESTERCFQSFIRHADLAGKRIDLAYRSERRSPRVEGRRELYCAPP